MDYAVPNAKVFFVESKNRPQRTGWYWESTLTPKECYWLPPSAPLVNGPFASAAEAIADCRNHS